MKRFEIKNATNKKENENMVMMAYELISMGKDSLFENLNGCKHDRAIALVKLLLIVVIYVI